MSASPPNFWLRPAIPHVPALLQPVGQALLQSVDEVRYELRDATRDELWTEPGAVASAGFHLLHCTGSLDRLMTYARGEQLSRLQLDALARESAIRDTTITVEELVFSFMHAVDVAIAQLVVTDPSTLLETRDIGRSRIPTTVMSLLVHCAEHTQRHVGQLTTTIRIVQSR